MSGFDRPAPAQRIKVHVDAQTQATAKDIAAHSPSRRVFSSSTTNILLSLLVLYLVSCYLFTTSIFLQSQLVYLHFVRWPLGDLTNLFRFGIVEGRSVTLYMNSSGGDDSLRGYHLLPPGLDAISAAGLGEADRDRFFEEKLKGDNTNIVIYLHGNGATRAHHRRISVQKHLGAYCNAHVLTFDYRGYGDSVGTPSEAGTAEDVGEILAYLQTLGIAKSTKVFLYAESLGTGIAVAYMSAHPEMAKPEGIVNGLMLLAPFVSLPEAALSHPAAAPFRIFPVLKTFM
jgi:abhydrolase domain-containing protein 12